MADVNHERCMAWAMLRAPYLIAYVLLFLYLLTTTHSRTFSDGWRVALMISIGLLIVGSASSYAVVAKWKWVWWSRGEQWEYASLWVSALLMCVHALVMLTSGTGVNLALANFAISALLLGQALNMGWRNGPSRL